MKISRGLGAGRRRRVLIGTSLVAAAIVLILFVFLDELRYSGGDIEQFGAGTIGAAPVTFWQGVNPGTYQPSWFEKENWKKQLPGKNVDVIVDKGHSSERLSAEAPPPSDGDTASTHDLFVYAGGRLTFASSPVPGALKIYGTWHVGYQAEVSMRGGTLIAEGDIRFADESRCDAGSGIVIFRGSTWRSDSPTSFFPGMSSVVFEGASEQTISGDVTFYDLEIRTADSVRIRGHVIVSNSLQVAQAGRIVVEEGGSLTTPASFSDNGSISDMNIRSLTREAGTSEAIKSSASIVPTSLLLEPNFPNPFNPTTTIRFTTGGAGQTTLKVYDIQGRAIRTLFEEFAAAGQTYSVTFDGTGLSSGTYLYVLQSGELRKTGKMMLTR